MAEGYFKECPITFKDIATVKNVFKEKLKTIYHTRISYPELKKVEPNGSQRQKNAKEQNICCKANGFNCIRLKVSVSWNDTPGRRIRVSRQEKPNTAPEYSFST